MTRQRSQPDTNMPKPQGQQARRTIPDKPRDCGPNVDTWPILDTPIDAAPGSKEREHDKPQQRRGA